MIPTRSRGCIFDEGRDDPIERVGQLIVLLASGQADALSGRIVTVRDDFQGLLRDAEAIRRDDRNALRMRT